MPIPPDDVTLNKAAIIERSPRFCAEMDARIRP